VDKTLLASISSDRLMLKWKLIGFVQISETQKKGC